MNIVPQSVEFKRVTPDALELIEEAARTCYKSEDRIGPGTAEPMVRRLIKMGHESPLEHASVTFRIICDRGVSHELVRHRLCSFSQESTRYVTYGKTDAITVVQPPGLTAEQKYGWAIAMGSCQGMYMDLLRLGQSPQIARSVLPNSLKTELIMTANFREWRTIVRQRLSAGAHPQMKEVMRPIWDWFNTNYPVIVEDILP